MPRLKKSVNENQESKVVVDVPKLSKTPQLVKGMKDILPQEQRYWDFLRDQSRKLARDYGFSRIDTPMLEDISLYTHSVGKQTDIIEKEMYMLEDRGGNTLAMRPEFTAAFARAYIEHGMITVPQPVKMYTIGPLFRYDKPQEGRYRQHNQFNCEVIGDGKPAVDAQVIFMAYKFFKRIGLSPMLHINSIGCLVCRPNYKTALTEYYRANRSQLCEDCKRRLTKNPLRLLDCKEEQCQPIKAKAPHLVDFLCEDCKDHFMAVLEFIDEFEIPYQHNAHLVRGLDYYVRTVFEFTIDDMEKPLAIGGGGRWDNLIQMLGGQPTPACGFGLGLERVILAMKAYEQSHQVSLLPEEKQPLLFVAQLGDQAKRRAMLLYEDLLAEGFDVSAEFSKDSLKAQLEIANRLNVQFTLILGQKELIDGTIIIRNMEGGEQEVIDGKKLIPLLQKKMTVDVSEIPSQKSDKKGE